MDGYIIRNRPLLLSQTSALITCTEREGKRNRKANRDRGEASEREKIVRQTGERGVGQKTLLANDPKLLWRREAGRNKTKTDQEHFEGNVDATDVLRVSGAFPN